jgi:hypothetical protein
MIAPEADRLAHLQGVDHPEHDPLEAWQIATDTWQANDASFSDYCTMASMTGLPDVSRLVRQRLGSFTTNVGLDIAGGTNGVAIQELIADGAIDTGIVTNLLDKRGDEARNVDGLLHIEGDILKEETWHKLFVTLSEASEGAGPSLIMHRPCAALQYLSPHFYEGSFNLLFDWLRPGGVMFAQVPLIFSTSANNLQKFCGYVQTRDDIAELQVSEFITFNYSAALSKAQ